LDGAVLPPTAALRELRAAPPTLAPLPLEVDAYENFRPRGTDVSRLVVKSILPGAALFAAVLFGRVLLAGPAPAPLAPAPIVTAVEPAPVVPAVEPAPMQPLAATAVSAAPAPADRRASRSRDGSSSRSRSRAASDASSRDDSPLEIESTRPSRSHATSAAAEDAPVARAAAPESTAAEPTSGIGILRVNSRPWSQVVVDGKLVGNTPQMGLRLRAGTHTVELTNPELGMSKKFKVDVKADDIVTRSEMLED